MNVVYLSLGGNCGKREEFLYKAFWMLTHQLNAVDVKVSSIYETEAWGNKNLNPFLNQIVHLKTTLNAHEILRLLLSIEKELGRDRTNNAGTYLNRTIDIDILFFNNEVINENNLIIPHPHLHNRRFILLPMCELNSELLHPVIQKPIQQLLKDCSDNGEVKLIIEADEYLKRP